MSGPYKLFRPPGLKNPSLLVSWDEDVSSTSTRITGYLSQKLAYQVFAEIEPAEFFSLAGVEVEDSLVRFPESKFYFCPDKELIIFKSDPPTFDWYQFLDLVLQIAQDCQVRELYAVGGMVSLAAHTTPKRLMAVFNSPELKAALGQHNLDSETDYETPPGQRPTLNSFLLWAARRRGIPGVNLWVPTTFYLLAAGDPKSQKEAIEFFNQRFSLGVDLTDLDQEIARQHTRLAELRNRFPEISGLIARLECNLSLSQEENERLAKAVEDFFKGQAN